MKKTNQLSKTDNNSITRTSNEIYKELLKILTDYHKCDARKLARYLHDERRMTPEAIGRILGMTRQGVEHKYLKEEVSL